MAGLKVNQRGAIVIMTVFFVIILIAFAAFALDLGRLYVLRTDMQNAADASSLAGAVELNGQPGAQERAVKAASNLLSEKGQFTTYPELLKQLAKYWKPDDPANSTFVFYSWIGAEPDPARNSDTCTKSTEHWEDDNLQKKCITTDDADARYIKVKLDPDLTTDEKKDYGIDFYFIPVLSLLTGTTITEGFTKVMAIAGNTDATICNLPPLMICAPEGGFDSVLSRGQEVKLKTQGPGSTWLPGDFAFLEPVECQEDEANCTSIAQLNRALTDQLAEERKLGCTPPRITPLPGDRQPTAYGVNTRLGLYGDYGGIPYRSYEAPPHPAYPAATNIIDYPHDQTFVGGRFGNGNWDAADYFKSHHDMATLPTPNISRFQTYYWELYGTPTNWDIYHTGWENDDIASLNDVKHFPEYKVTQDPNPPATPYEQCMQAIKTVNQPPDYWSNNDACLNLVGSPDEQQAEKPPATGRGVEWANPSRRVWFIAALNCADYEDDINNRKPFEVNFGPGGNGDFVKFFITSHIRKGPPTEIYAEYLGPATGEEKKHILIHNIVQLYE